MIFFIVYCKLIGGIDAIKKRIHPLNYSSTVNPFTV